MTPEKMAAQLCFQIFDPLIIINNLSRSQVQIYFSVYDLAKNNLTLWDDAPLISLLHQQAVFAGVLHGSVKALHGLPKLFFIHRLDQIIVGLYLTDRTSGIKAGQPFFPVPQELSHQSEAFKRIQKRDCLYG